MESLQGTKAPTSIHVRLQPGTLELNRYARRTPKAEDREKDAGGTSSEARAASANDGARASGLTRIAVVSGGGSNRQCRASDETRREIMRPPHRRCSP